MNSIVVKNGLLAGVSGIVVSLVIYLIEPKGFISWGGWVVIFPVLYCMVQATKETREANEGLATLREAFTPAWLTYLIYTVIYSLFTYVLMNIIDPGLIDLAKEASIEAMEKMSGMLGEEAMQAAIEEMEKNNPYRFSAIIMTMFFSLVFPGAIVALIIGLIMKKNKPESWG